MKRAHIVIITALCVAAVAFGCRPDQHLLGDGGGGGGDGDGGGDLDGGGGGEDGWVDPDCATGAEWIYLVDSGDGVMDSRYTFLRFEPDTERLVEIGDLSCPGASTSPFSMSVDRDGTAWVLYQGGYMFHVNALDASCQPTDYVPNQNNYMLFGMGFVADAEGSSSETLFIAGGPGAWVGTNQCNLGQIDTASLSTEHIASLTGSPELTGTGSGELWGFFPDPPSIQQIDKQSGEAITTYDLPQLGTFYAEAWAFAFWGGRFYIFLKRDTDQSTHIWRYDPSDSSFTDIIPDTGYRIVGAGVSTCAPYVLI